MIIKAISSQIMNEAGEFEKCRKKIDLNNNYAEQNDMCVYEAEVFTQC